MAGPIQTAIGQALGAVASVAAVGTKLNEDKRQTGEKERAEIQKETEAQKAAKEAADAEALKKEETAAKEAEKAEKAAAKEAAAKSAMEKKEAEKAEKAAAKEAAAKSAMEKKEAEKAQKASEKAKQEQASKMQKEKADIEESEAVATEADLRLLGVSEEAAKAYLLAQRRGTASPNRILFDDNGKPIATYEEMSMILADESLSGTLTSRLRGKDAIKQRRFLLEGKTHKERVENAILAEGGLKK